MSTDIAAQPNGGQWAAGNEPWNALFGANGSAAGIPLGTARWLSPEVAVQKFAYRDTWFSGRVWIGEAFTGQASPLGYIDDRHVCLVSGSRGGKGVGVIVPNLCFWPGSAIIVDPKGENATVTARRRGDGSAYTHAMGQQVRILDPFGEVDLPEELKAHYNPLDAIDPESDYAVDDAGRVAASLVVVENRNDPYWEEAARNLIKGLILHVLTAAQFEERRNLVTVRRLLSQGDWLTMERLQKAGDKDLPSSSFNLLWERMRRSKAFNGVVAGVGEQMVTMADKQRSGVLESARTSTQFLESVPMQRMLQDSDFDLAELKTNPKGLTIYLTLPARYMETHYRWLRLMITLAVGEMERIKGRPATGHPTLFLLDEFAGLKRMEVVEHAAAQAAGFGVKFLFVVQNLPQIEDLYEKSWETFLGNSGLKLFFQIDDDFTRSYLARQLGELETTRQTRSGSQSQSLSDSTTKGNNTSYTDGHSTSRRPLLHFRTSKQTSSGYSKGWSFSRSRSRSDSATDGWSDSVHKRPLLNPDEIGRMLARNDDRGRPGYPGIVLALIPGEHPLLARRVNYFESPHFLGLFDPHPNHPPPLTLAELAARPRPMPLLTRSSSWHDLVAVFRGTGRMIGGFLSLAFWGAILYGAYSVYQHRDTIFANSSPPPPVTSSAPTPQPASPPITYGSAFAPPARPAPAQPAQNSAYDQGVADWRALQAWFATQSGDRRAGADWWAAHRSHDPAPCSEAAADYSDNQQVVSLFEAGCTDAKRWLDPIDAKRTDPQYKAGFNYEAGVLPLTPAASGTTMPARLATVKTPDDLKLREGPGAQYNIVYVMYSGNRVRIIKDLDNGWKELEFQAADGRTYHGFSSGRYLVPDQ
jgi:type IV secretory pathway TraG/TraD family ATPase VirD4